MSRQTVEGLEWEVSEVLAAKDRYHRGLFAAIPAPLLCPLRLGLAGGHRSAVTWQGP